MTPIESLHAAYCEAMGLELRINPAFERYWFDAINSGLEPDDLKLVIKARIKKNFSFEPRYQSQLTIKKLVGDEDRLAEVINEAAMIRANMRKKTYTTDKSSVLRATGRADEPPTQEAKSVKDVIVMMKEATQ